jgi:hypothetical protein
MYRVSLGYNGMFIGSHWDVMGCCMVSLGYNDVCIGSYWDIMGYV